MAKKFTSKPIGDSTHKNHHHHDDEALEKLDIYYRQDFNIVKPDKKGFLWILVVLLSALFGLASSLAYSIFFTPSLESNSNQQQKVVIEHQENVTVTSKERLNQLTEKITPSVVNFYSQASLSSGPFYQDSGSLGSGFILTSDGWLVTTRAVIEKADQDQIIVFTSDYQAYAIKKIIFDPLTPLVFVHIEADNLPAVKLGSINNHLSGQKVFGIIASYPYPKLASLHLADIYASTLEDVVASTEKFNHFVSCREGYDASLVGAPLINLSGEVIAVVNNLTTATPVDYFKNIIDKINRDDNLTRTYFGVHYINLAKYPKIDLTSGELLKRGALLSGYKNLTAVVKNSPADKAGLKVGDIILSVEDDLINGQKTLTQIIQEYSPGDTLEMTILRNGKEQKIKVKLGELE